MVFWRWSFSILDGICVSVLVFVSRVFEALSLVAQFGLVQIATITLIVTFVVYLKQKK
ncbi:putative holin-like toxin [Virgibacillus necropolis]|uniref:putative holin-like toxin n=1 Tax=Virgibacillus necropolis TaxID=163877 RepID=UPI00384D1B45